MPARNLLLLALLAVGVTAPAPAAAEVFANLGEAMNVQAEKLEIDVGGGAATLLGNVTLTRGDLKVACPRIELKFDATPHVVWIKGSGGVTADWPAGVQCATLKEALSPARVSSSDQMTTACPDAGRRTTAAEGGAASTVPRILMPLAPPPLGSLA